MGIDPPAQGLRVLGIAGSPRRGGNTDTLLNEVLRGAASRGADIHILVLCKMSFEACRHCDGCLKTGSCVVKDDMQKVYKELREADCIVLASPIFFMGVSAQTKAMIDRCQALWVLKYVLKKPVGLHPHRERKGLFVSVGGMPLTSERLFGPAKATVKAFFATLDVRYAGELLFQRIDERDAIASHPTALKEAFLAGQELVADVS
jgi:multimeric flavodoxin WrbA